jgi:catechol 2,3-dioxygenase-like lactoylglutathione lyase family enzyme
MSLSNYRVGAAVAVSDMNRARAFYEGKLGFAAAGDDPDGGRTYECAEQTTLHIFPSPAGAEASGATVAEWTVDDLEHIVDELTESGVTFERYDDEQISTNERASPSSATARAPGSKTPTATSSSSSSHSERGGLRLAVHSDRSAPRPSSQLCHSVRTAPRPRRLKRSRPRLNFICANTGSIIGWRLR